MSARAWAVGLALVVLASCGGNSSSGGGSPVNNVLPTVSNLGVTGNYADGLFASVTICAPGTSTCQTIDNVLVDTGSFGLRLLASQVNLNLPDENANSGDPLGECTQYQDSFTWGPVVTADVQLAGEKSSTMPIQLLGEPGFPPPPSSCASSGLAENDTQATLGANGILGIGVFRYDCGSGCTAPQTTIPPVYYSCPASGCLPTLVSLEAEVQNPVWLFPQDNNGVVIRMPSVPDGGAASVSGSLIFGVNTRPNNSLGSATVLAADGAGNFATTFQGMAYSGSILDSGSNAVFFLDGGTLSLPLCAGGNSGFYCPSSTVSFSATNQSASGTGSTAGTSAAWNVANAADLFATGFAAFNNLGGPNPGGFDFGLPFFFGRAVFIGVNGTSAGQLSGPFYAY